ncbi:MAG: kelch repeat-containing protein [Sandaracinaceae bacterium]
MTTTRVIALFALLLSTACDGAAPVDAGLPESDAGPPDAGRAPDPTEARFASVSATGPGPWDLWGFQVAAISVDEAIVLGGTDTGTGSSTFEDVWRVRVGADGTLSATAIEATGPAPRYCGCMAYDAARDTLVVYGGRDLTGPVPDWADTTWELDLTAATWTERSAAGPIGTLGCAMAYSPSDGRTYLFGGANRAGAYDRMQRYDRADGIWTELAAEGPVPRYDAVMLPDGGRLLLFGGSFGASGAAFYADLWSFDVASETWSEIALPEGPPGRRTGWVVRDPERPGLYVGFGFDGSMNPLGDLHYADLEALTWTEIELPFDGPAPRGFSPALPGGESALGVMTGGNGGRQGVNESWRLVR